MFTRETCAWSRFDQAEILLLAGTAGAGSMTPPASTIISTRLRLVGDKVHLWVWPRFDLNLAAYPAWQYGFVCCAGLTSILAALTMLTTLRMQRQLVFRCSSLSTLDPGSGREIPVICHDTGV